MASEQTAVHSDALAGYQVRSKLADDRFSPPWPLRLRSRSTPALKHSQAVSSGSQCDCCSCLSIRSSFPPHQFFVTRMPISLGSVQNTFVVRCGSSLFKNAPVMAVVLTTFLS